MKIKITIIEIDFPDEQGQPAYKPEPPKSFFDRLYREVEHVIEPQLLMEDQLYGSFLAQ
jgi:hypothetical protein